MFTDLLSACDPVRLMKYMLHLALNPDFVNKHLRVVEQIMNGVEISARDGQTMMRLLRRVPAFDGAPGLAGMDAPTLIIAGELDILTPPSHARRLHAELPNSRLIVLDGVAHTPLIEAATETFAEIRTFLTQDAPAAASDAAPTGPHDGGPQS
jgi:pimeloyl-ACP methyl ester carboxylesterase